MLAYTWDPSYDPDDYPQGYLDIEVDAYGYSSYYYSSTTSVYFRIPLESTTINSQGELRQMAWHTLVDVNNDGVQDWDIMVGGISETMYVYYNGTQGDEADQLNWSIDDPLNTGYVQETPAGYGNFPDLVYFDFQVPYTALSAPGFANNIEFDTPIRFFTATTTNENSILKDALGISTTIAGAFADVLPTTFGSTGFGIIYDSRDADPYSDNGVWETGEQLLVNGFGWPPSVSSYYNNGALNMRILNSSAELAWSGTVTTNVNGELSDSPAWPISSDSELGLFAIEVQDPTNPNIWNEYDTFTVIGPILYIQKTADTDSVSTGEQFGYTITIGNTGTAAASISNIYDFLYDSFSYVSGSTSGITSDDPVINGTELTWTQSITLDPGTDISLTFSVNSGLERGTFFNIGEVLGSNIPTLSTGNSAPVTVTAPVLTLVKEVDLNTAVPGDTLTYIINYLNTGDDMSCFVVIHEAVPQNTEYVPNSASAGSMSVEFSHDGGFNYDSSQTLPVTNLRFIRSITFAAGDSGFVQFQVIVE